MFTSSDSGISVSGAVTSVAGVDTPACGLLVTVECPGTILPATGSATAGPGILMLESVANSLVVPKGNIDTVAGNAAGSNTVNAVSTSGRVVSAMLSAAYSCTAWSESLTTTVTSSGSRVSVMGGATL